MGIKDESFITFPRIASSPGKVKGFESKKTKINPNKKRFFFLCLSRFNPRRPAPVRKAQEKAQQKQAASRFPMGCGSLINRLL